MPVYWTDTLFIKILNNFLINLIEIEKNFRKNQVSLRCIGFFFGIACTYINVMIRYCHTQSASPLPSHQIFSYDIFISIIDNWIHQITSVASLMSPNFECLFNIVIKFWVFIRQCHHTFGFYSPMSSNLGCLITDVPNRGCLFPNVA